MCNHKRDGVQRIADERRRQVEKEGWTEEHDDEHDGGELAVAAACYASPIPLYGKVGQSYVDPWPWDSIWDKRPGHRPALDCRIRALEKAGALVAAEIDRLLRTVDEP